MKQFYMIISMIMLVFTSAIAQKTVTGTVIDAGGEALIGANVVVEGTDRGTVTEYDGTYSISASEGDVIIISYTGYDDSESTVGASNTLDFTLVEGVLLTDVVVTAIGIKRDVKTLGYSATKVSGEELTITRNNRAVDALSGKVAGLAVSSNTQPGGSSEVVVRGYTSVTGSNSPLWVIDGVPVSNSANSAGGSFDRSQDFGNQANDINPDDIESMTILKGAAATALYGSRAGNGAIIVTTKSGKKKQKIGVDLSTSYTRSQVNRLPHLQNTYGQGWSGLWASNENGSWGPEMDDEIRLWGNVVDNSSQLKPFSLQEDNVRDFYTMGNGYNLSLGISGGTKLANYRISYGYANEDGVVPTNADSYERHSIGVRGGVGNDKFSVNTSISFINKHQKALATGQGDDAGQGKVLFQEIIQIPRDHSIIDYADLDNPFNTLDNFYTPYAQNPYWTLMNQGNDYYENRIFGSVTTTYNIMDDLVATWRIGGDFSSSRTNGWGNLGKITPGSPNASANSVVGGVSVRDVQRQQLNNDLLLTYTKSLSEKILLTATVGHNVNTRSARASASSITDLVIPGFYDLANTSVNPTSGASKSEVRSLGVYAMVELAYADWLYLTVTGRNDWFSTLPKENNSVFYPAASLSAVISEVTDLSAAKISFLKLRASFGQAGNGAGSPYLIDPTFSSAGASAGYGSVNFPIGGTSAFELGDIIGNNSLKPEVTTEFEIGMDLRVFLNRIGLDIAYYSKSSNDQILASEKAPSGGFTNQYVNLGKVTNKGIELALKTIPVKLKNGFEWGVDLNYTKNTSKVVSLGDAGTEGSLLLNSAYGIELRAEAGMPLGTMYAPTSLKDDQGNIVVNPTNGLPLDDVENKKFMGSINPDFSMGFGSYVSWKGFRLAANADWRKGGVMFSYTARLNYFVGNSWNTQYNDREPWIVPGSVNMIVDENEIVTYEENMTPINRSDVFTYWGATNSAQENHVISKTFFKLRNVSLSYSLPDRIVKKAKMSDASLTVFGRNLVLWTPSGNHFVDPEGSTFGLGLGSQMGEFSTAPSSAQIGITFNAKF